MRFLFCVQAVITGRQGLIVTMFRNGRQSFDKSEKRKKLNTSYTSWYVSWFDIGVDHLESFKSYKIRKKHFSIIYDKDMA